MQVVKKNGVKLGMEFVEGFEDEFLKSRRIVDIVEFLEDIDYESLNLRGTTKYLLIGSLH